MKTALLLVLSANAAVAAPGDIVYTEALTATINRLDRGQTEAELLYQFQTADSRPIDMIQIGDAFYVGDGPRPETNPGSGRLWRFDDLLGGAPVANIISEGDPLQVPVGLAYDKRTDTILAANNPVVHTLPNSFDGILAMPRTGGQATKVFEEERPLPRPYYKAGGRIAVDPLDTDDFFVTTLNGGIETGDQIDDFDFGSVLYRMTVDESFLTGEMEILVDLSNMNETGLDRPLTFTRGVVAMNDGTIYISDGGNGDDVSGGIYRITLDEDRNFEGIEEVIGGLGRVHELTYNPYQDTLFFAAEPVNDLGGVWEVGVDGTGLTHLTDSSVNARGIVVIPSPGAGLLLLALGARRRRA